MQGFIVMDSSATKGGGAAGRRVGRSNYRRIALVEVENTNDPPKMISTRAIGLIRIVEEVTGYAGRSFPAGRCQASLAAQRMVEEAKRLNAARPK